MGDQLCNHNVVENRYDVGDGTRVRFWHDLWQGETPLKERYLNLYLTRDSEAIVADYVEFRHENFYWTPLFNCA